MPLSAVNFVPSTGQIKAADIKQFFDLFTGVMTDQPVTFANTLQVGGSQGAAAAPVRIGGVAAQTANMVEVRKLAADVQPELSISPTGTLAWGPGGATGTDVTLARSLANQLTLTGLAGTPALVVPVGGITVNGAIDFTGATTFKGTPQNNLLVNPGFEIWQRGNGPFTTGNAFCADRWFIGTAGTDTISISKDTVNVDSGSVAAAAVTFTLGTGAGGTNIANIMRFAADGYQLAGKTVTFSIRAKTATATAVRIGIVTDGTGGTTTYSVYHTGSSTWQTLTVTVTVPTNATYTYAEVFFAASATIYLDNATLVVGSVPMDYLPLTPADDLARCLRYYQRFVGSSAQEIGSGQAYSTTNGVVVIALPAEMGASPVLTVSATSDWGVSSAAYSVQALTSITLRAWGKNSAALNVAVAANLIAGNAINLLGNVASPWLALEWNP